MTEEDVTKKMLAILIEKDWSIICYDFPQSGTGKQIHPNGERSKTDGIWNPDIVAHKNRTVLCFENKDHFVQADVEKLEHIKNSNCYSEGFSKLLKNHPFDNVYYGVALPWSTNAEGRAVEALVDIDFAVLIKDENSIVEIGQKVIV